MFIHHNLPSMPTPAIFENKMAMSAIVKMSIANKKAIVAHDRFLLLEWDSSQPPSEKSYSYEPLQL